jgi:hypothetical protein
MLMLLPSSPSTPLPCHTPNLLWVMCWLVAWLHKECAVPPVVGLQTVSPPPAPADGVCWLCVPLICCVHCWLHVQGAVRRVVGLRSSTSWVTPASGVLLLAGGTYTLLGRLLPGV